MTQKFKAPDFNTVLTIGGFIAGAYILYKFSNVVSAVKDFVGPVWQGAKTVGSDALTVVSPSTYIPPPEKRKDNPIGVGVKSPTSPAVSDPYYSDGMIYDQTYVDPMGNVSGG